MVTLVLPSNEALGEVLIRLRDGGYEPQSTDHGERVSHPTRNALNPVPAPV
jgi:hypothetical protein